MGREWGGKTYRDGPLKILPRCIACSFRRESGPGITEKPTSMVHLLNHIWHLNVLHVLPAERLQRRRHMLWQHLNQDML